MTTRQPRDTADMVVVLVGDDDGGKIFGGKAKAAETGGRLAESESTVEQNPGGTGLDDQGIAPTAAAQRCGSARCLLSGGDSRGGAGGSQCRRAVPAAG
jgi:hypothetical protein